MFNGPASTGAHPVGTLPIPGAASPVIWATRSVPATTPAGRGIVTPVTAVALPAVVEAPTTIPPVGEDGGGGGAADTVIVAVAGALVPAALAAVNATVYVPPDVKVCAGFCAVAVDPSPKFHDHEVGDPVERSVNCTANGAGPLVTDEANDAVGATGAADTVIVAVTGALVPAALAAVNATVYVPPDVKVCAGFCAVAVDPSPKFHDHEVGDPVERSVNCT